MDVTSKRHQLKQHSKVDLNAQPAYFWNGELIVRTPALLARGYGSDLL